MINRPPPTYTAEERASMLERMRMASDLFYSLATGIGCHPFLEFTGLMNEYIKICQRAHDQGIDFNDCSAHSGQALPMEIYEAEYIGEKLGCIYGPSVQEPLLRRALLKEMGLIVARDEVAT